MSSPMSFSDYNYSLKGMIEGNDTKFYDSGLFLKEWVGDLKWKSQYSSSWPIVQRGYASLPPRALSSELIDALLYCLVLLVAMV